MQKKLWIIVFNLTCFFCNAQTQEQYNSELREIFQSNDYKEAIHKYDSLLRINKKDEIAFKYRGMVKSKAGDNIGAIKDFSEAIKLNSQHGELYVYRGDTYIKLKDFNSALTDLNNAVKLIPHNSQVAYYGRGLAKEGLGDYIGAVSDFTQSIKQYPKYTVAYIHRGLSEIQLSKKDEACTDFQRAHELGAESALALIKQYCLIQ